MPSPKHDVRMNNALDALEAGAVAIELHARTECIEEWSSTFAVALVEIMEPEDTHFFDYDKVVEALEAVFIKHFGRAFTVLRGLEAARRARPGRLLVFHRRPWSIEVEAYVKKVKPRKKART
jgi:hypothetical protein